MTKTTRAAVHVNGPALAEKVRLSTSRVNLNVFFN